MPRNQEYEGTVEHREIPRPEELAESSEPEPLDSQTSRTISQEIGQALYAHHSLPVGAFGELDDTEENLEGQAASSADGQPYLDPEALAADLPTFSSLSPAARQAALERLVGLKLVTMSDGFYHFPDKKKAQKYLLSGDLELTEGWLRAKERMANGGDLKTLDNYTETLVEHDKRRAICELSFETGKPGFNIGPINGLKLGHQDSLEGFKLAREYLRGLEWLSANDKPDVLLVSDLMQGTFKHAQSKRRSALPPELQDAGAQFRIAHELIDEMRATGIPVVITMGDNDHREAQDYATDAVRELQTFLNDAEKNDFVHFGQIYKYSQNALWQDFRQFALEYVIPISQKYGRRLRTAEEMETDSDGRISKSEFMHLYEHLRLGYPLSPTAGIDPDDLVAPGTWSSDGSVVYVDDVDLVFKLTDGREERVKYRHNLGLSPESLLGNHMTKPQKLMGALGMAAATLDELPTALISGSQQEAAMVTHSGTDIITTPGLTNPLHSIDTKAFYRRTTGDSSLRALASRGRAWTPGIYEYGHPEEGVVRYTIYDKDILERADSIPRMAIITFNDWQIGSPTAHPDMVLYAQALAQRYARRLPVAIHGEGDFKHGFIYPNMAREAQAIGLMDIDSQAEMVNGMIRDSWHEVPRSTKDGVFHVLWLPGNHDEEQRYRVPGNHSRNVDDTIATWRRELDNPDIAPEDSIIQTERVFESDDGTPVPTWIGRPRYGDYSLVVAHYHINSKNYKGGNGGLAVYDPLKRLEGMGGFEDVQIASGAHHHNRMHVKVNGVWVDIGDANAAGQSEFENMLGMHHSNMSVKVRELGGGLPMTVSYYTEKALVRERLRDGPYSTEQLADAGFHDDPGANPLRYSMYSLDGSPQTAIQQRLWEKQREASQWAQHMSEPLHHTPGDRNRITRRLFELAAARSEQLR